MSRTVVVTGASSGIGLAAAVELARRGDEVVLLGRNARRLAGAAARVHDRTGTTPRTIRADFAVLDEVRAAGAAIHDAYERIHVLVNNAGGLRGLSSTTVDGHETTMQVNHLAGFLLAHLLLDRLRAAATPAAPARLITTASLAEAWGRLDVDRPLSASWRTRARWLAYGSSKQAAILFTVEAARRWTASGVVPTCFFPGLIRSRFASSSPLFMLGKAIPVLVGSPARGADTLVWLATDEPGVPGGYYFLRQGFPATSRSTDPDRAARLWRASARAVGLPQ
jgi:NAD(P)-dependent dehydrogenase (short-subunit alcohol dehydrogenase family)